MAHYVLSDIHGYLNRFTSMLERIGFSDQDTLYILGDVIDRGPEGVRLLEQIRQTPNMILLLGNHEYMCLQAHAPEATERDLYRWSRNGCAPTVRGLKCLPRERREAVLEYLDERIPLYLGELDLETNRTVAARLLPAVKIYREAYLQHYLWVIQDGHAKMEFEEIMKEYEGNPRIRRFPLDISYENNEGGEHHG